MKLCVALLSVAAFAEAPDRFFDKRIAPILEKRCLSCHNQELNDGGISFVDRDSLLRGGRLGAAVVPGKPDQSVMIQAVRHTGEIKMPPGPKLSPKDVALLTEWVRRGAIWGTKLRGNSPDIHR